MEISVEELLVPRAVCLKNKIPWNIARNGRGMRGSALEQNKTTNKEASKSCVYHVLKNNSAESKPAGLTWECCGLASPTELNWNALFVFQQACKSWQRSDQLFKPCWTALGVQLLHLVRGPAEKLSVQAGCRRSWQLCLRGVQNKMFSPALKKNVCCLRKMCPPALFFSEAGACCVNRNMSSSLGNYFMLVTLHKLA